MNELHGLAGFRLSPAASSLCCKTFVCGRLLEMRFGQISTGWIGHRLLLTLAEAAAA